LEPYSVKPLPTQQLPSEGVIRRRRRRGGQEQQQFGLETMQSERPLASQPEERPADVSAALARFRAAAENSKSRNNGRALDRERRPSEAPRDQSPWDGDDADIDWGDGPGAARNPGRRPPWNAQSSVDVFDYEEEPTRSQWPGNGSKGGYLEQDFGGQASRAGGRGSRGAQSQSPPKVDWLTAEQGERLIPIAPRPEQYSYYQDQDFIQRVSLSFLVGMFAMAFTSTTPIAVGAAAFPFIAPMAFAATRNFPIRNFQYCGLWRAKVISVEWSDESGVRPMRGSQRKRSGPAVLSIVLGDDSGARTCVELPTDAPRTAVRIGDNVEALVVSNDRSLIQFKVVREIYLAESQFWLADYPFIDRYAFRQISNALQKTGSRG